MVSPKSLHDDLMTAKVEKLLGITPIRLRPDVEGTYALSVNDRVWIPSAFLETPHRGTVTEVERERFKVTWDSDGRKKGEPRLRLWYPWSFAHNFKVDARG